MTMTKPISDRQRTVLSWLQKCAAEAPGPVLIKRPNAASLAVLRALENRGLITMVTTTGYLYIKTGRMSWNWAVTLTPSGKDA